MKPTLHHVGNGYVRLPNGSPVVADHAIAMGYTVEGLPPAQPATASRRLATRSLPTPAVAVPLTPAAAQVALDARFDAILSLPEAAGRLSAAREVARSDMPVAEAGRFLASLPVDEPPPASPPAAPTLTAREIRSAEIKASVAAFNRGKGYAR